MIYSSPKLNLPDVTLFMADTACTELSLLALADTLNFCDFGHILIFSHEPEKYPIGQKIQVPLFVNVAEYSELLWYEAPRYLNTSHLMMLQWDSWVVKPEVWTNKFLEVDYIGAPWPDGIGNSGFSLRSKRLMQYLIEHKAQYPLLATENEDKTLCRTYRPSLEQKGFKWPTGALAAQFSFEYWGMPNTCFGFHGIFNWKHYLKGEALTKRIHLAMHNPYIRGSRQWRQLLDSLKV